MVTLYLWVRTLLPLLAFVIAWMLLSRLIRAAWRAFRAFP